MFVNKINNTIIGANLNKTEKKALDIEIKKELKEMFLKHENELDAAVLWVLHDKYGFGTQRLREFYFDFQPYIDKLLNSYDLGIADEEWFCTKKLAEYGIDISSWREEAERSGKLESSTVNNKGFDTVLKDFKPQYSTDQSEWIRDILIDKYGDSVKQLKGKKHDT